MDVIEIPLTRWAAALLREEFPNLSLDEAATELFTAALKEKSEALKRASDTAETRT